MTSVPDDLRLAADFAPASYDDWRKLVDGVLKGAPFEKLVGKTYDGLKIEPIYRRARDAAPIPGRTAASPWQIMQRIDHPDAAVANAQALHDLENGATGLTLIFAGANGAHGFGLEPTAEAIEKVLDGIFMDAGIALELQIGPQSRMAAIHVAEYLKRKRVVLAACDVRFGLDPVGAAAVWGASPYAWPEIVPAVTGAIKSLVAMGFEGPFAAADGRVIHDAGGSEVQELAFVLATGVACLRALEDAGVALETAQNMIYARLSADADQFLTMAKFRALRLLWSRIEQACGLGPKPLFIAAETAWRMLTQRDPYVNMLRATMATFSAGLGGADAITVLPHTLALGLPDPFARRAARNTQLVLLEESNLAKVSDPAAGSGGIETLTQQLCEAAWSLFQDIEKAGGVFAALEQNLIQRKAAATRAVREANIARRKEVLIGASEFPNLHEAHVAVLDAKPVELAPYGEAKFKFDALPPIRLAAPFEHLRDRSDQILKDAGSRPKVFLANLGTPADFTARATFAKSFFETGGIEAVEFLPASREASSSSPLPSGERSTPPKSDISDFGNNKSQTRQRPSLMASGEGALASDRNPSPAPPPSAQERPLPMGEVMDFAALAAAFKGSGAALACLCSSDKLYAEHAPAAAAALQAAGARHIYLAARPGEREATLRAAGVNDFVFAGSDALAALREAYGLME
jgi:methylmalonyl-CoA mutase